jgi:hypothetical protein
MQVAGFIVLLVTSMGFVVLFLAQGIDLDNVSLWGEEWGSLFGVVLFNFALVIAIPAWLYEKEPGVVVPVVIHTSSIFVAILYMVIGILGAITMPHVSQNMLEGLMSGSFGTAMQLCASIFTDFQRARSLFAIFDFVDFLPGRCYNQHSFLGRNNIHQPGCLHSSPIAITAFS